MIKSDEENNASVEMGTFDDVISNPENMQLQKKKCSGLKKEELMVYLKDPYWRALRFILLIIFIISWLSMLILTIVVIILTPKCPAHPQQNWWQEGMVYCLHVKSFYDSDNDGVGDFNGIISKLGYIKDDLLVKTVMVTGLQIDGNSSNVNPATNTDFISISPQFGSIEDFHELVKQIHKKGMKLVLELSPFSTTTTHPWFKLSRTRTSPYQDYYIWASQQTLDTATDSERKESYYIDKHQHPILNFNNQLVVKEVVKAIEYWLSVGVDGIKVEGSEDVACLSVILHNTSCHQMMSNLVDVWMETVKQHTDTHAHSLTYKGTVLMTNIVETTNTTKQHLLQPINNHFLTIDTNSSTSYVKELISDWLDKFTNIPASCNWRMSSADGGRLASRVDVSKVNVLHLLLLTLPGVAHVYYGDEIALQNAPYTHIKTTEEFSTNIMLWSDDKFGGFSKSPPWYAHLPSKSVKDVQSQMALGSGMSHLKVFKKMAGLREHPSLVWGDIHLSQDVDDLLFYVRQAQGHPCIIVVLNLQDNFATFVLKADDEISIKIGVSKVEILTSTHNFNRHIFPHFSDGSIISLSEAILLEPNQGLVLECIADSKWYS